jgi:hypothetical protein
VTVHVPLFNKFAYGETSHGWELSPLGPGPLPLEAGLRMDSGAFGNDKDRGISRQVADRAAPHVQTAYSHVLQEHPLDVQDILAHAVKVSRLQSTNPLSSEWPGAEQTGV